MSRAHLPDFGLEPIYRLNNNDTASRGIRLNRSRALPDDQSVAAITAFDDLFLADIDMTTGA